MSNKNLEASYLKIGLFVLAGITLVVLGILAFGSSKLLQPTVYIETYFDESIQGITEGSPVKYRGLQIGYVKDIAFTSEVYHKELSKVDGLQDRSIYIKIGITSPLFTHLSKEQLHHFLADEIASGLRVKLEAQGLTGITYLEFNYVDPLTNPVPKFNWQPENVYIPSATSTFNLLSSSVRSLLLKLNEVDFTKLAGSIGNTLNSLAQFSQKGESFFDKNNIPLETTLWNLKNITDNFRVLSEQLNFYPREIIFGKEPPLFDPSKL